MVSWGKTRVEGDADVIDVGVAWIFVSPRCDEGEEEEGEDDDDDSGISGSEDEEEEDDGDEDDGHKDESDDEDDEEDKRDLTCPPVNDDKDSDVDGNNDLNGGSDEWMYTCNTNR